MTLKSTYHLNTRTITHHNDNLPKMCVCVLLVLLVICGIIGLTIFIVKNAQSNLDENSGRFDYFVENDKILQNKQKTQHPGIRNDYTLTSVEGKVVATSNTAEFTSTIESPLSTSTMSPKDVPARFLIVNTIEISKSDYSTADSSNDYVRLTTKSDVDKNYLVKRSTDKDIVNDAPDKSYIDAYIQSTRKRNTEGSTEKEIITTPITGLEAQTCKTNICKQSASRMLALLNHSAAPCEDFYTYACGGFEINHFKEFTVNDNIIESLPGWKRF